MNLMDISCTLNLG